MALLRPKESKWKPPTSQKYHPYILHFLSLFPFYSSSSSSQSISHSFCYSSFFRLLFHLFIQFIFQLLFHLFLRFFFQLLFCLFLRVFLRLLFHLFVQFIFQVLFHLFLQSFFRLLFHPFKQFFLRPFSNYSFRSSSSSSSSFLPLTPQSPSMHIPMLIHPAT
jgi:hypothetical protein